MDMNLYEPPYAPSKEILQTVENFKKKYRLITTKIYHIYLLKEYYYYTPEPFEYVGTLTLDATTTFKVRAGNCFALTNLFVCIGRESGLASYYYYVEDVNSTYVYGGTLITATHIVCGFDYNASVPYIVDFLPDIPENYRDLFRFNRVKRLTDLEASGLFYNNIACKFMLEKDYGIAEYIFKFAEYLYPDSPKIKNNIGVLYKRLKDYGKAADYFLKALSLSKNPQSIISNIIKTKKYLPDSERVKLEKRISSMLKNNYYWHLMKAEEYIAAKEYKRALKEIRKADKLSPGNQEVISFYLRVAVLTNNKKLYEKYKSKLKYY